MYGMTDAMLAAARRKVKKNKEFMETYGVEVSGQVVPFADFVQNSYMNPNRYVAELNNRVYSLYEYAEQRGLRNVFFTLTLPSVWHATKKIKTGKRVPNPKFGGRAVITTVRHPVSGEVYKLLNTKKNQDAYAPKRASKAITRLLKRLFDDRFYKSIEKDDRVYFRVTEPHKDGTPHIHVSFFVPAEKADAFADTLRRLYPAPQGKVEQNVHNPVAYLMKYVLKTLDDLRYSDDLTALSLWYVYHGIGRIYTSRTLIDLQTYRALNGRYDLIELTNMYRDNQLVVMLDKQTNKVTQVFDEFGLIYSKKHVVVSDAKAYDVVPTKWKNRNDDLHKVEIDGEQFYYRQVRDHDAGPGQHQYTAHFIHLTVPAGSMSDFELLSYYGSLDIETVDLNHFVYVVNQMIDRGLLNEDYLSISAYSSNEFGF